ncbi:dienelactone hydrolase family protein [Polaribacter sp.]
MIFAIITFQKVTAQIKAEDFGFRHFQYFIEGDSIDVLVKSKIGDENKKKPIFFSVQGSLGVPLIIHNGKQRVKYSTLEEGLVEDDYHLIIVNKPGIPLISHKDSLSNRGEYYDNKSKKIYPKEYVNKNYLEYYVKRNISVIELLLKENWVDSSKIIVSGHSQGSGIAAKMADNLSKITHLIYSSGLPYYSTILAMLHKERMMEEDEENPYVEKTIDYWKNVVKNPYQINNEDGWDSNMTMYSFSKSQNELLKRLKIPILISYGTKDESSPYQDLFRIETINEGSENIEFKVYVGLDHNYQFKSEKIDSNKKTDYLKTVIGEWLKWLKEN